VVYGELARLLPRDQLEVDGYAAVRDGPDGVDTALELGSPWGDQYAIDEFFS
jgi:hypothetical protein